VVVAEQLSPEIWSNVVDEDLLSDVFLFSIHELNTGNYIQDQSRSVQCPLTL